MLRQNDETENPLKLKGLRQAMYILRCLEKGQTEQEIITKFEGDSQLVQIWILFLIHNRWTEKQIVDGGDYNWIVTDKGQDWTARYFGVSSSPVDAT